MNGVFSEGAMAGGYAVARPPLHEPLTRLAVATAGWAAQRHRVLDIGCGAGASTRAALPFARRVVGIDPEPAMIEVAEPRVPEARFATAHAEALPICDQSVDGVIAAGSLNFVELHRFHAEMRRVMCDGEILAYDFATGSRSAVVPLAQIYGGFVTRWPRPTAGRQVVNVATLSASPFELLNFDDVVITIDFELDAYVDYLMTETNVAAAVRRGEDRGMIRRWCANSFGAVFDGVLAIEFDCWIAVLQPQ